MVGRGRGVGRRLELAAPDWIVQLVRLKPVRTPWPDIVRVAVAVPGPLAVGILFGRPALGLFAAMGALAASIADRGGPLRARTLRQAGTASAGACGLYLGHLAAGTGWLSVSLFAVVALVSALMSVVDAASSMAGMQLLVYLSIGSGLSVPVPRYLLLALYLAGALWAMGLTLLQALLVGGRSLERAAVADVYAAVADLLVAAGTPRMADSRQALTDAMNIGYDSLLAVRSRSSGRNPEFRRLAALLNAATPVVEASIAIAHSGHRAPGEVSAAIRDLADAVRHDKPAPPLLEVLRTPESYRLRALRTGINDVRAQLGPEPDTGTAPLLPPRPAERIGGLFDRVLTGPDTWWYAARLVLCMSLAEILRGIVPLERSYWVPLTVAIVLKPDFGSVFARGVQRGLGTTVGVLIGAALLVLIPRGVWLLPFMAVAAGLLPLARERNYGMFAIFLTPLATLLIDFGVQQGPHIVLTRLWDTLAGCGLALVFGYLLWPETWSVHLGRRVADAVDATADYLRVAFGPEGTARGRRRRAYRTLSDVRTSFQQKLAEPPPVSSSASAWWPMIVQLERTVDAITAVAIKVRDTDRPPAPESVHLLVADLRDLATALRDRRSPDELPLPEDELLAAVSAEVRTARQVAAGPEPAERSLGEV